jgi:bifunctional non-homologous end joining protein LigD
VKAAPAAAWTGSGWPAPSGDELAALDALGKGGSWQLGEHTLRLTNLDKVLFPKRGRGRAFTKRDLIRHNAVLAPMMLPYLANRPINMHRYPNGVDRPGFWHKAVPSHAPDWLARWHNDDADPGETTDYLVLDSPAALAWVANYGAVELHPWTSTVRDTSQPTWALIDIDPGDETTFDDVVLLAGLHRTALEHLGVRGCPKLTGKRGIQIWIPVADGYTFADTRQWVEAVSRAIGATVPELVSWRWDVASRGGLARLDYTQNAINKTLIAPFSTRAAPGAPVSVPITWDELDDPDLAPDRWTIDDVGERIREAGDPLALLIGTPQHLPPLS